MKHLTINALTAGLTAEEIDSNLFSGAPIQFPLRRIFGGQVLAQALYAAARTVDDERVPHSLHAYFLRPGDMSRNVIYDVDPIRDGRSFCTRRVVARQHGRAIFNSSVSFQKREKGFDHQIELPEGIPQPDDIIPYSDYLAGIKKQYPDMPTAFMFPDDIIDIRVPAPIHPYEPTKMEPIGGFWFKFTADIGDDPLMHRSALAFISDKMLMSTALRPHSIPVYDNKLIAASLDHAMWFHSEIRVDQWIYYYLDSPRAARSRGLNRGLFYTQDGMLMASTIQEGLMRLIDEKD
jgi:acyl-CoA thioesterase-2